MLCAMTDDNQICVFILSQLGKVLSFAHKICYKMIMKNVKYWTILLTKDNVKNRISKMYSNVAKRNTEIVLF